MATPKNNSVIKAFAILKAFQDAKSSLSGVELSRRANLPLASGYRLIQTMEDIGAISRSKRGQYRPGVLLLSICSAVRFSDLLRDAGEPILRELAKSLGLTIELTVSENGKAICVEKYSSAAAPKRLRASWNVPEVKKSRLAYPDDSKVETHKRNGYILPTENRCVAVSVQDGQGRIVASISASDGVSWVTPGAEVVIRRALLDAAASLQDALYGHVRSTRKSPYEPTSGLTEAVSKRPEAGIFSVA